ncbi:Alpha/Beta hydrolase protein, partial [Roridomyces roridus]
IQISYTDSGVPSGSQDYKTIVIVHGMLFNKRKYGFDPLHAYAAKYNTRIICPARRGYPGSTPFTPAEVAEMEAGSKTVQERLARQVGWFLLHLIEKGTITDGGGIVLVGWSLGNATTLSLLGAEPGVIEHEVYHVLEKHLRRLVLYDPPYGVLGHPAPPPQTPMYNPYFDPELSAFYDHPGIHSLASTGVNW